MSSAVFIDEPQLKLLKQMDTWLSKEPWQNEVELKTAMDVRTLITKIEKRGYYYEGTEQDLLNYLREEYIKNKNKNKK